MAWRTAGIRHVVIAVLAVSFSVAALFAVTAWAPAEAGATVTLGKLEATDSASGPVSVKKASVKQSGKTLTVSATTYRKWSLKKVTPRPASMKLPARYLCFQLRQAGTTKVLCPGRAKGGKFRVYRAKLLSNGRTSKFKQVKGSTVLRKNFRQVSVTFDFASVALTPGTLNWAVVADWTGPACEDGEHTDLCRNQAPIESKIRSKIRQPRIIGCTTRTGVYHHGDRNRKWIALTYDDGPSAYTLDVLNTFRKANARATFFMVGSLVGGRADTVRQILKQGSELANHSWSHEMNPGASSLSSTNAAIRKASGFTPCMFRPPYGSMGGSTLPAARSLGMGTIIWDIDTIDYRLPGAGTIASRALSGGRGSIVLMHDGGGNRSQTVAATKNIVNTLKLRGFQLVTVSEILGAKTTWSP